MNAALKHDADGFLLGEPIELRRMAGDINAMQSDIHAIRSILAGNQRMQGGARAQSSAPALALPRPRDVRGRFVSAAPAVAAGRATAEATSAGRAVTPGPRSWFGGAQAKEQTFWLRRMAEGLFGLRGDARLTLRRLKAIEGASGGGGRDGGGWLAKIAGLVTLLGVAVAAWRKYGDEIKSSIGKAIRDALPEWAGKSWDWMANISPELKSGWDTFWSDWSDNWNTLSAGIKSMFGRVTDSASELWADLKTRFNGILDSLSDFADMANRWIKDKTGIDVKATAGKIADTASAASGYIKDKTGMSPGEAARAAGSWVKRKAGSAWRWAKGKAGQVGEAVMNGAEARQIPSWGWQSGGNLTSAEALRRYGSPESQSAMIHWQVPDDLQLSNVPKSIYVNRDMVAPLARAFRNIKDRGLEDQIHSWDGAFNIRNKRGLKSKSLHSWGLAVDINAAENPLGKAPAMSREMVNAWKDAGFDWGGDWSGRKDGMHFQLGRNVRYAGGTDQPLIPAPAPSLNGADEARTRQAIDFFMSKGLTAEQATGIVGNMLQENPGFGLGAGGDSGKAAGLFQWQGSRQAGMGNTFESQLQHAWDEMTGRAPNRDPQAEKALTLLRNAQTAEEAAAIFSRWFERPGDPRVANRQKFANGALRLAQAPALPRPPTIPRPPVATAPPQPAKPPAIDSPLNTARAESVTFSLPPSSVGQDVRDRRIAHIVTGGIAAPA